MSKNTKKPKLDIVDPKAIEFDKKIPEIEKLLTEQKDEVFEKNKKNFQQYLDDLMERNREAIKSGSSDAQKKIQTEIANIYRFNPEIWDNLHRLNIDPELQTQLNLINANILRRQGLLTYKDQQVSGVFQNKKPDIEIKPDVPKIEVDTGKINTKGKKIKPTLGGIIGAGLGLGLSMYSPNSKAAAIAQRALEEGDPSSFLFPAEAGEGEEEEVTRIRKEQKDRYFNNLMKNIPENENVRSVEEMPIKKVLEGKLLSQAQDEEDETELANNSVEDMKYEDYIEKMKRKLGYV